ncbi:DUF2634 domain-containing protein [Peptostreptococcus equinus]|uniref:DUF2634 domain-containing protein n=1 Tax=Peptostreptococcus equinus TaxID=3003601 RepID=A0ABY7JQ30_9FIRM|nr:DUF2634 domain-containing protein [Peptostreptococcus sp. CBA3647]WAW15461.1 DUF2634 domain-containing protein [Peptostreptococcus sp. CBA3647]
MIPNTGMEQEEFEALIEMVEKKKYSNKDFKVVDNRIVGIVDGIEELKQTIFFILSIEKYQSLTVSENTGVGFWNLYGDDINLVMINLKSIITDALLNDDRIEEITEFIIEKIKRNTLKIEITVKSNISEELIEIEREVDIG